MNGSLFGQGLDSLKHVAQEGPSDTARFQALKQIAEHYWNGPADSALHYANRLREVGERSGKLYHRAQGTNHYGVGFLLNGKFDSAIKHLRRSRKLLEEMPEGDRQKSLKTSVLSNLGLSYRNMGAFDSSERYFGEALEVAKAKKDSVLIARQEVNLGTLYKIKSEYPRAKDLFLSASQKAKALEKPEFVAKANTNLGVIHLELEEYEKALKRFKRSIAAFETLGLRKSMAEVRLNTALAYQNLDSLDQALEQFRMALEGAREIGGRRIETMLTNNLGELYLRYYQDRRDSLPPEIQRIVDERGGSVREAILDTIEGLYTKVKRMAEENGFGKNLSFAYYGLGDIANKREQWGRSRELFQKSLEVIQGQEMRKHAYDIHKKLAKVNSRLGDHREAYEHHKQYARLKDSVFNEKKSKELGRLDAEYAYEKKLLRQKKEAEKQEAIAREEKRRKRVIFYSMGGGLFLVLLFSGVLINRYRLIRFQKRTIEEQKSEVESAYEQLQERDKEITHSLNYASSIQQAILPSRESISKLLPKDPALFFKPKEKVSGDLYWCNRAPDGSLVWVVGDCTGHGVPGAFMSMIGVRLFNEAVLEKGETDPGKVLDHVRSGIIHALGSDEGEGKSDGMDAVACSLSEESGELAFAGANNPLYILHEGRQEELPEPDRKVEEEGVQLFEYKGDKMAVGAGVDLQPFTTRRFTLRQGDMLYSFSDGFADQFGGEKGKKFRYGPFKRLLCSLFQKEGTEQERELAETFEEWRRGMEQVDDVCVFGVRFDKG